MFIVASDIIIIDLAGIYLLKFIKNDTRRCESVQSQR